MENYSENAKKKKIEDEKRQRLDALIKECNEESGLGIQICYDNPDDSLRNLIMEQTDDKVFQK